MVVVITSFILLSLWMDFLNWSLEFICLFSYVHHFTQVLMFPFLLDFEPLFTEFELFVEAIDNKHELALSGNQQFPVCFISGTRCVLLLADSLLQHVKWWAHFLLGSLCITILQEKRSFCWISLSRINGQNQVLIVGWLESSSVSQLWFHV